MELVYTRHVTECAPSKTGEYQSDISHFEKIQVLQKIFELEGNECSSLHLAWKYA